MRRSKPAKGSQAANQAKKKKDDTSLMPMEGYETGSPSPFAQAFQARGTDKTPFMKVMRETFERAQKKRKKKDEDE